MSNNSLSIGDPFLGWSDGDGPLELFFQSKVEKILWHEVKLAASMVNLGVKHGLKFSTLSNTSRLQQACRTIARLDAEVPAQDPSDPNGEVVQAWIVDRMNELVAKAMDWAANNTLDHTEQAPF